ncbi:hypothetical protein [Nocardioides korecus]
MVIVDADNPLREIYGEFFWREDHERVVTSERERAFQEGYQQGLRDASASYPPVRNRRRARPAHVLRWTILLLVAVAFFTTLIGSMTR